MRIHHRHTRRLVIPENGSGFREVSGNFGSLEAMDVPAGSANIVRAVGRRFCHPAVPTHPAHNLPIPVDSTEGKPSQVNEPFKVTVPD